MKKQLTVIELAKQFVKKFAKPLGYTDLIIDFESFDGKFRDRELNDYWFAYSQCAITNKIVKIEKTNRKVGIF